MPPAQLIDAQTGEFLEDLGFFETANQARTACARHADQMLTWERSPDGLWIAEGDDEVYHVEADPPEEDGLAGVDEQIDGVMEGVEAEADPSD